MNYAVVLIELRIHLLLMHAELLFSALQFVLK